MIGEKEVANSSDELPTWGIVVNTPINVRVLLWWLCAVYWLLAIAAVALRRRLPSFGGAVKYGGRQSKSAASNRDEQADIEIDADAVFTPPRSQKMDKNSTSKKEDEDSSEKEGGKEDTTSTQEYLTPFTSAHFARRKKTKKKGSDEVSSSSGDDGNDAEGGSGGPSHGQQMSPTASNGGVISTRLVSSIVDSQGDEMPGDATSTFPKCPSPPTTREANDKLPASSSSSDIRGRLVGSMSLVLSPLQYQVSRKHSFIAFYVVGSISSLTLIVLIIATTWWWNTEIPTSLPFFFTSSTTSEEYSSYLQCPCFTAASSSSVDNNRRRLPPVTKGSFKDTERRREGGSDGALTSPPPHLACGGRTTPSGLVLSLPTILGAFDRQAELRRLHHSSVSIPQGGSSGGVGGRMLFKYAFGGGGGGEEIHVSDRHTTSRQFTLGQLLLDMRLEATSSTNTSKSNADGKPKVSRSTACCGPSHPKTGRAGSQRNPFSSKPEDTPTKECPCHPARQHSSSKPTESPQHCWLSEPGVVPPPSWYVVFIAITPLSLFLLHCVVRLYECHAVFVFRDSSNTLDLNIVSSPSPSHQGSVASSCSSPNEGVTPPPFQPPTATKKATVAAVSSPDVVTLFAALSGCSFYVAAPVSIGVTSLETLIKFTEVGLSALMKTAEVASAAEAMAVAAEGGVGGSNPKSHQSISLLDTAVFGGGVLLVGFVVILIFSLIFFFLQGLQVFHHVILARLQRRRLAQRRIRIDNYRMSLLDSRRRSSEGGSSGEASQKKKKRSSVTAASSIARGLPPDLEPPYVYPYEEGLFSHVLEPHYAMEAAMYVCIIVLTVTLFLYAEGLSQLLQSARLSSLVPSKNLKLDATYLTYPQPVGGDFAVWGYRPLHLLFPHHNSESASSIEDESSDVIEIGLLGNDGQATRETARSSLWTTCNTLLSQLVGPILSVIPPLSTMEHALFACRLWVSLVPTILVALFTIVNLNTTAQEHREFWVRVGGVIDLPRYNVIPGLL